MTNLLEETIVSIKASGYTENDVDWVGSKDGIFAISWEEAKEILNLDYDSGFGAAEVATDLVVVFKDGLSMHRGEYDGSEWWEIPQRYKKSDNPKKFTVAGKGRGGLWESLEDLNK